MDDDVGPKKFGAFDHKTVRLTYGKFDADIDEKIAPLILACWKLGIETLMCCENNNNDGCIAIKFPSDKEAAKFVFRLDEFHEPEYFEHKSGRLWGDDMFPWRYKDHEWKFLFDGFKVYPKVWKWKPHVDEGLPWPIHLFFPVEDLPAVMKCFQV